MNKIITFAIFISCLYTAKAQSCSEIMEFVKSKSSGMTYYSYNSDAISKVTFYTVDIENQTYYFAIVCFKKENSYTSTEYIYQVSSGTRYNYSASYIESAGKAFWAYIHPYNKTLGCAPDFN